MHAMNKARYTRNYVTNNRWIFDYPQTLTKFLINSTVNQSNKAYHVI